MVDRQKVEQAIRLYLEGIGEDVNREGLLDTPSRIARMCEEVFGGLDQDPGIYLEKQFSVENNEMVIEKDITFYSMCEHHLLLKIHEYILLICEWHLNHLLNNH